MAISGTGKKATVILKGIARNYLTRVQFRAGMKASDIGATHRQRPVADSVAYIRSVFEDYSGFGRLNSASFAGKRILEIGPGDNFGVALMFLSHGAAQVTTLDKFITRHDPQRQTEIYRALLNTLSAEQRQELDTVGRVTSVPPEFNPQRLRMVYGHGVEEASEIFPAEEFDFIVSRAVLEEVFAIGEAFEAMRKLLRPGGALIHKIDLSDYGLLSGKGYHPLEFLTISEFLYSRMCSDSGLPNRRRIYYYRDLMERYGFRYELHVTRALGRSSEFGPGESAESAMGKAGPEGKQLLEAIRPRLAAPFRNLPAQELMALGMFLVAWKPSAEVQNG